MEFKKNERGYYMVVPGNIERIIEESDKRIGLLIEKVYGENKKVPPFFFLAGGGAVMLGFQSIGEAYVSSKDIDYLWAKDYARIDDWMDAINAGKNKFINREISYGGEDEGFFSFDMYSDLLNIAPDDKFLVEFLNLQNFIENDSEYDAWDLREDLLNSYINPRFDNYRYVKICNPYITWYTRLVTLRNDKGRGELCFPPERINSIYYEKTLVDIQKTINLGIITKKDVEENIGSLINKYFCNSPLVLEDFEVFMSELEDIQ